MKKIIKNFNISIIKQALSLMGSKGKVFIFFILGFCAIELVCTWLSAIGMRGAINSIIKMDMQGFWLPMGYIIIKNVIWWIYAPVSSYVTAKISKQTLCNIKTTIADHIMKLPMNYHDKRDRGELLSILSNDTRCLSGVYDWSFFQVLRSATGGIGGVIIMAVIDWRFTIVVFSLGTISVYMASYFSRRLEKIGDEQQEQLAKTSTDAYELIKAAKTIRLFHMEKQREAAFIKTLDKEAEIKNRSGKISTKMNTSITTVNMVAYIAILITGALFVYYDLSNWGTVIAILSLKDITDMIFVEFGQFMAEMQTNVAGVKRILDFLDIEEEVVEGNQNVNISSEALSIENICFSYDGISQILSNFSLKLGNKGLTALLGESGAGKSTIIKLILGLYTQNSGQIFFNNHRCKYKNLREATAYVPQEATLFKGTISENIALGNPLATDDMIINAAKMAGADEFIIKLKDGYATEILDNGQSLSGGQKQRIAIARALLKDSPILLLDEITSGLDQEMEIGIIKTISEISRSRAVLLITHNINLTKWADEIIRV